MIFILSDTPPKEDGYYWALIPPKSFLGEEQPAKWEPVEMDGGTIWIVGSDVPALRSGLDEGWKWGPKIELPISPVKERET